MAQGDQQRFCLRRKDFQTNMVSSFKHRRALDTNIVPYSKPYAVYCLSIQYKKHKMQPTHPIHFGLVLNFSIFYYKMLNSLEKVCQLPKTARPKHIITFYTGSSSGCIPQIQFFNKEKTLTRIKNTSPPPSLGIGQAGGGM